MSRLIDADMLTEVLKSNGLKDSLVYMFINQEPTVDAEPVVRCKDCIYQTECAFTEWLGRNGNGFCSSGERREDAETN